MKAFSIAILCFIIIQPVFSQNLKRQAYLGVELKELSVDERADQGVLVLNEVKEEYAKAHHLKKGDIIIRINDQIIKNEQDLRSAVSKNRAGDLAQITVLRNGKSKTLKGIFASRPFETSETLDIIYDELAFENGWLRIIIDKPRKSGPLPAILFIQGYTCGSLDNVHPKHPYIQLVKGLAEKGYVVMRVEKPGDGDCFGTPECEDIGFHTEVSAFKAALLKLKSYDFVDPGKIFLWGHSMGGIIAPILASEIPVTGMVVYGTGIKPWREYLTEMVRVQNPLFGVKYMDNEKKMLSVYKLMYALYIDHLPPAEIAKDSIMAQVLYEDFGYDGNNRLFTRNYKYLVEIDDYNLTECWSKVNAYVLSMWGTADIEAYSSYEHETIVEVVNQSNPDKAELYIVENTTHAFSKVESMKHGIENRTAAYMFENFNNDVILKTDEWIQKVLSK
jgi:pimeloyl-ACP methyl ester carboxylesterase